MQDLHLLLYKFGSENFKQRGNFQEKSLCRRLKTEPSAMK
jgi:hypothetical protein